MGLQGNEDFGYHNLERAALGFVLESETWPVFLEWFRKDVISDAGKEWANGSPDIAEARYLYMLHSPDPIIRAAAEMVKPW